ncbi:MAG: alginate lyase family protein [Planctomycetes bacterium]|nr:alginate lyase family protein [Planctomycetota bacterium]
MGKCKLLKYTYPKWDPKLEKRFMAGWDKEFLSVVRKRDNHQGNWMTAISAAFMSTAIFKNDNALLSLSLERFNVYMPVNAIYESGQSIEVSRDLNHAQVGIASLIQMSEYGWNQGVDLYSKLDNRLAATLEFTAKEILSGTDKWRDNEYKPVMYEMGYNHYHNRMGMEMPYTKQIIDKHGVENIYQCWGLGTFLKGKIDENKPVTIYGWRFDPVYRGVACNIKMKSYGGQTPVKWSLGSSTKLPSGLSLQSNGSFKGKITASAGIYKFKVKVTDRNGIVDEQQCIMEIKELKNSKNVRGTKPGLRYEISAKPFSKDPGVESEIDGKKGYADNLTFDVAKTKEYGLRFSGYIEVPEDGKYVFFVGAENQHCLYIGDTLVKNEWMGDPRARLKPVWQNIGYEIGLEAGKHPFCLIVNNGNYKRHFRKPWDKWDFGSMRGVLQLNWITPSGQKQKPVSTSAYSTAPK